MEFQEALMKLMITKSPSSETKPRKHKWRISFHRTSSESTTIIGDHTKKQPPKEFQCPITGSLMHDPVIDSSGHTFERISIQACKKLNFTPTLSDGTTPDFSTIIPNLALKSAIVNWCNSHSLNPPKPLDSFSAEKLVHTQLQNHQNVNNTIDIIKIETLSEKLLIQGVKETPSIKLKHAASELTRRRNHFNSSSNESISSLPLQLTTRPSCYSTSSNNSSSEIETLTLEEQQLIPKLKSPQVHEVENAVVSLRQLTKNNELSRLGLCSTQLLTILRSLIQSRYSSIQVNAVAALVNLSLEKSNKVKIVRSGIVPSLIDVLKFGTPEAQEHAAGAIFSLSVEDNNKTAIGVLGALPPLLNLLRSESELTRHESALALYHLSLVESNRSKLIKHGSVPVLLNMVKSGHIPGRVLLVLSNLASSGDGRAALLDNGGVECLVSVLRGVGKVDESVLDGCMGVMYGLSQGGLRFKGLAKAACAGEVLEKVIEEGKCERAMEKAGRVLEIMKVKTDDDEEEIVDWAELLDSD
ncbi:hypothetical protein ACFE04_007399 [Oxalis oulophora]